MVQKTDAQIGFGYGRHFLVDPRPYYYKDPQNFHIPSVAALAALKIGDAVLLWLRSTSDDAPDERIWVRVAEIVGNSLIGQINNGPRHVPLKHGDTVRFRVHHILKIERSDGPPSSDLCAQVGQLLLSLDDLKRPPTDAEIEALTREIFEVLEEHRRLNSTSE